MTAPIDTATVASARSGDPGLDVVRAASARPRPTTGTQLSRSATAANAFMTIATLPAMSAHGSSTPHRADLPGRAVRPCLSHQGSGHRGRPDGEEGDGEA